MAVECKTYLCVKPELSVDNYLNFGAEVRLLSLMNCVEYPERALIPLSLECKLSFWDQLLLFV